MTAHVLPLKSNAELALVGLFEATKATLPGNDGIFAQRAAAFDNFVASGLPHRRVEAWKYTDLRNLMGDAKPLAPPPDAAAKARARGAGSVLGDVGCRRLVVANGSFVPELSDLANLEHGLSVRSMAGALVSGDALVAAYVDKVAAASDPMLALNTALMGDGVVVHVAPGATIERPLHLVFVTTGESPAAMFMRSLVVVEEGARVTLIESYEGPGDTPYQVNAALELVAGDGARVDHVKINSEGGAALHIATLLAEIGARATFNSSGFTNGGAVVRNQLFVRFAGEGTVASIGGVSLLKGKQHADTTLVIDHAAAHCESRQLFKAVLDGESRSVFQGRINVHPHAQKTGAKMMTRALLLSDEAEADSKPELEIFADDVQCGHGSTAGALDEGLKFYLMARGIPAKEAEALLIQAFIGEAVDTVAHEGIRDALTGAMTTWLRERG